MFNRTCKLKANTITCISLNKSHLKFSLLNSFIQKILVGLVIGLCSTFFISPVEADEEDIVQVSFTKGESSNPQLMIFDNIVYNVWFDNSTGNYEIFFSKSTNASMNFENTINLSNNNGTSAFPRMVVNDNYVHVTWYDYSPGRSDIFFARSMDNGASFETINLSQNNGVSFNPWIKAYENNVYVVWNDETPHLPNIQYQSPENVDIFLGDLDILIATSHDGGAKFDVLNLSNSSQMSVNPRIAVSGSNVYVVWDEQTKTSDEIYFSMSTDNGTKFSESINISRSDVTSNRAGIQVSGDNVYIIWHEISQETSDIFFAVSNDNGLSFSLPINLSTGEGSPSLTRDTQMAIAGNNVFVVWSNHHINNGIFLAKSSDGGRTFGEPINLNDFKNAEYGQLAVHDDKIYVIWAEQFFGNKEIFLRYSLDGGESFGSKKNISNDGSESNLFVLGPQIALMEDDVFVVFERKDTDSSNLYLSILRHKELQPGILLLQTINGTVNVEIGIEEKIEPEIPVTFILKFFDSETGKLLENVNYSFLVHDVKGNIMIGNLNQKAVEGLGTQTVTFEETGSLTIVIDIDGIGVEQPYDKKYAGKTSYLITVVPEFPIGVVGVMIIAMIVGIVIKKLRSPRVLTNTIQID